MIKTELEIMGVSYDKYDLIREKDGVLVARVHTCDATYILKYFENPEYRREIANYRLLASHNIPTLKIFAATDRALLMEDVSRSENLRLGQEIDMTDPEIARKLAAWYKKLHAVQADLTGMYDESDFFTRENIDIIKEKTQTCSFPAWEILEENFDKVKSRLDSLRRVITYNDFYYTNLIVARDKSTAFMFDYNLLGKGYALSDVRNVTYSLSPAAAEAFLAEYGPTDPEEQYVDDVVSPVTTLCMACRRKIFPAWAEEALNTVKITLADRIRRLTGA